MQYVPATAAATKQEIVFVPVFGFETVLAFELIDQVVSTGSYIGLFDVTTDASGLWGDYAIIEVMAPSLSGFGVGTMTVHEAEKMVSAIPLPAGGVLLLSGLLGIGFMRRKQH